MRDIVHKISDGVDKVTMVLAIIFLILVFLSSTLQVLTRYVLNASLSWTEECARYTFVWTSMMGTAVAYKRGAHVVLDLISARLKGGLKKGQIILSHVLVITLCLIMLINCPALLAVSARQPSTAMHIPMIYFYISVPLGFAAVIIHALDGILQTFEKEQPAEQM